MIENGVIYEVRVGNNYKEKVFKCYESSLVFNVNLELTETSIIITGEIYKKHYENGVVELNNNVELTLECYDNVIELSPDGGMIGINLEIPNDVKTIYAKELGVENVNGYYELEGVE